MEFFRIRRDIPFMRHALVLNVVSFITFAAAVFFIATRGLHLSIEFTGGTVLEVEYTQSADINKARTAVESLGLGEVQVQSFGTSRDVLVRLPVRGDVKQADLAARVFGELCKVEGGTVSTRQYTTAEGEAVSRPACALASGAEPVKLNRTEFVGPQVGEELVHGGAPLGVLTAVMRQELVADALAPELVVFDTIVYPEQTPLLQLAHRSGCQVVTGREMMQGQIARIVDFFIQAQQGTTNPE